MKGLFFSLLAPWLATLLVYAGSPAILTEPEVVSRLRPYRIVKHRLH